MTKYLVAVSILLLSASASAQGVAWVLSYENRSTNELVNDARFERLLNTRVPAALSGQLRFALFGPPDPVIVRRERYVSMSACLAHGCAQKGFLWLDTRTGIGLGAQVLAHGFFSLDEPEPLTLASNGLSATRIPSEAMRALLDWLVEVEIQPEIVTFIPGNGNAVELNALAFRPTLPSQPPSDGPGFDCVGAAGAVERAICQDPELSRIDVAMFKLFDRMKHSYSTIPSRREVEQLHEAWRGRRDSECSVAIDIKSCLVAQYRVHTDVLNQWIPTR